jgi:uncharacterized protein DUF6812
VPDPQRPLFVPTERIEALIRTTDLQIIVGKVHAQPGKRLKDEMNADSARYIAITDAKVFDATARSLLYETSFLLVANDHIVSVTPKASLVGGHLPWLEGPAEGPAE